MKKLIIVTCLIGLGVVFAGNNVNSEENTQEVTLLPEVDENLRVKRLLSGALNEEAPIPPQCYTKTEGVNNPCYTCHQNYYAADSTDYRNNRRNDGDNQGLYTFSDEGETNAWKNLFVNRTAWVEKISDEQIAAYINQDNYSGLANKLTKSDWQGFIPDLKDYQDADKAFNDKGIAKDGSGWVAFNYKPFPGTFWPTNGSTDDVLIRLPKAFRELNGIFNEDIYLINLSLVEMSIKGLSQVDIFSANERQLNTDLNQDNALTTNVELLHSRHYFIGDAQNIKVPQQQYPLNTEIMHSVRYVGVDKNGETTIPKRMKELRYMAKTKLMTEADIDTSYRRERKEKLDEQLPHFNKVTDKGFNNKFGWVIQGFIEDYNGALRAQSHEESMFCMGCHSAIGTTIDQTFSFPRKVTGKAGWGYVNLKGMKDAPSKGQKQGEILQYLQSNGGGNEFRENSEMLAKWYKSDGSVNQEKVQKADVFSLITPSKERAYALNKAYTHIVRTQSFIHGRDATISPTKNVHKTINESVAPLQPEHRIDNWDIRLDWDQPSAKNQ